MNKSTPKYKTPTKEIRIEPEIPNIVGNQEHINKILSIDERLRKLDALK